MPKWLMPCLSRRYRYERRSRVLSLSRIHRTKKGPHERPFLFGGDEELVSGSCCLHDPAIPRPLPRDRQQSWRPARAVLAGRTHGNAHPLRLAKQKGPHKRPILFGGDEEDRTPDLRIANATLSQLSYVPIDGLFNSNPSRRQQLEQDVEETRLLCRLVLPPRSCIPRSMLLGTARPLMRPGVLREPCSLVELPTFALRTRRSPS